MFVSKINNHEVKFSVTRYKGYCVAEGVEHAFVTQAKTLKELRKNMREASELYFDEEMA